MCSSVPKSCLGDPVSARVLVMKSIVVVLGNLTVSTVQECSLSSVGSLSAHACSVGPIAYFLNRNFL